MSSLPTNSGPMPTVSLTLLLRMKLRAVWNRVQQMAHTSPLKLALTICFLAFIWLGLYGLFWGVFSYFERNALEAAVAIPMVFNFFFAAMLVMLTVSNAIIAYLSLFSMDEAMYLLAAPTPPRVYVRLKFLETLLLSSWSLILLGLPLMLAMARVTNEPWFYYPLFVAFFICFVPIPGALGLVAAWLIARFLNRRVRNYLIALGGLGLAFTAVMFLQNAQIDDENGGRWLRDFLFKVDFIQSAFLPSTWVTRGVDAAMNVRTTEALMYLAVTIANALFLSTVAVPLVSRRFLSAFDRALSARGSDKRPATAPTGGIAGNVFFYLPRHLRLIAAKDLRMFLRDPLQWTQLLILFGLLALYLANLPRLSSGAPLENFGKIIPFLNFGAVTFLLATFTSRFVFPLVSLEGRQLWLVGTLPFPRGRLLIAKFAFALTVSVAVAISTTLLAVVMLKMPWDWAVVQVGVTFSACVGLCGLAVGMGARMPEFTERNAARIANGFGGTVNLVASVALVLIMFMGLGWIGIRNRYDVFEAPVNSEAILTAAGVAAFGIGTGLLVMWIGARHLRRIEF